jgi:predicted nuclease of predicted toxin-antitoxin system
MKFLCDVHIPFALVNKLKTFGFKVIHVNELPDKWNTRDAEICNFADDNDYVVITKDSDFRNSFFLKQSPKKIIKINLGNISNKDLIQIFETQITKISRLDNLNSFLLEISKTDIILTEGK